MKNPFRKLGEFLRKGTEERPRRNTAEFFASALAQAGRGEYAAGISLFRRGLKAMKAEDGIDVAKEFRKLWDTIESHAIRSIGAAATDSLVSFEEDVAAAPRGGRPDAASASVQNFLGESSAAFENLERVRALIGRSMEMRFNAALITDENLGELQQALTPPSRQ
jgi:hypothetical protein